MTILRTFFRSAVYRTLAAILLAFGTLHAGETGKITGTVLDLSTNEPIGNANVVLSGGDYGASTSLEGIFTIINVSPGQYSVTASYVGYTHVTIEDVMVYADLTTSLEFGLEPTVIEGHEVIVKAPRRPIKPDVTATTHLMAGDEIYVMPVANYVGAVANIGGAVGSGTNLHIRGGRRGEVSFLVDGVEVKDPLNNLRMLDIGTAAVAEMVALTGGFDAEYGNAQSAVVNVLTREGQREYHGRFKYLSDDIVRVLEPGAIPEQKLEYRSTYIEALDTTVTTRWQPPTSYQNYDYIEGSIGGPDPITGKLLPKLGVDIPGYITLFAAADFTGRNTNSGGMQINSSPWYRHQSFGELLPDERREQNFLNGSLQLTYHIDPTKKLKLGYRTTRQWYNIYIMRQSRNFPYDFSQADINAAYQAWTGNDSTYTYVTGFDDDEDGRIDEEALNGMDDDLDGLVDEDLQWYEYNAPDHTPTRKIDDGQYLLSWNHTLGKKTYYHIKLSSYKASRVIAAGNKAPWEYGEPKEPFTDLPGPDGKYNGRYNLGEPFEDLDGDGIHDTGNPGNLLTNYKGFLLFGDGTEDNVGQPVPYWLEEESWAHSLKFQLTSQVHHSHQLRSGIDLTTYDIRKVTLPYPTIDNNGEGIYTDVYRVYPTDGAAYIQDKMEYRDITLTLGMRADFYLPGEQVRHVMAFDTTHPDWNPNFVPFDVPDRVTANVSPRLGVSYFVTENAYLHAHYGHFYQRPAWDDMFESVNQPQTGGTPRIGNPALEPEKTVAFEIGIAYNPYRDYVIDVTGFLKDVKNWINTRQGKFWFPEKFGRPLIGQNYAIFDNQDYAFARGIEFNVSKEYGANISGRVTYTLAWVNAKNSYNISTQGIRGNYFEPPQALPAGWDQRHSMVANLAFNYGADQPLFGIDGMPGDWSVNLLWNLRSGLPYTPTDATGTRIEGQYMSKRTPGTDVADVNVTKYFTISKWRASIWFEVRNIFDRTNIQHVDDYYGRVGAPEAFDDYTGKPGWVNDQSSPNYILNPFAGPNAEAWDNPRYFRLGLGLQF